MNAGFVDEAGPVEAPERVAQIDILRGIALFGVLAINLLSEFRVSIFAQFLGHQEPAAHWIDRCIDTYVPILLELKAFALFSFLFGMGLAIQFERIGRRTAPFSLLIRRLVILLLFGVIHLTLIWNGDILTEYAVAGLIALPFLFLPLRWLCFATAVFAVRYLLLPVYPFAIAFPGDAWLSAHVALADVVYKHGSFAKILSFQWHELPEILPLHVFMMPRTIALFLFGAVAWRSGIVKRLDLQERAVMLIALGGLIVGLGLTVSTSQVAPPALFGKATAVLALVGELALTIGYAAAILYVNTKSWGLKLFGWAAPLGRMAFTNYIMQSVIFSFLFFGWGLGWFGMRSGPALLIGIVVYVLQVFVSAAWLKKFQFGPVEWLWRTMMYGVAQPMRRL